MKAIVDEGVPRQLVSDLSTLGRKVAPFPNEWKGLKNGGLIAQVKSAGFQWLVTCDKNLQHQQNLERWEIALVVLPSPFIPELIPHLPAIAEALATVSLGEVVIIESAVPRARN